MSDMFNKWSTCDICDLIDAYPMASIITMDAEPSFIDMPMLLERDGDGKPQTILGHLSRHSPIISGSANPMHAMFIFRGPSAYISPAMAGRSNWAPTWNFITVTMMADIVVDDHLTDEALCRTVTHMEQHQARPWSLDQLGERYVSLKEAVIGFRASIVSVSARFKLGQDETQETFDHIIASLDDEKLKYWMVRLRGGATNS